MTAPIGGNRPTTAAANTAPTTKQYDPDFKSSSTLVNGQYKLTEQEAEFSGYKAFLQTMGESHGAAISSRVEKKMTEWVKANPNADHKTHDDQLKKFLQVESLIQNEMKNSINKMMDQIMDKMKEMAADRFG